MKNSKQIYTKDDFVKLSWNEYQSAVDKIADNILLFLNKNNLKIDFIVPILRGGAPLGVSLSHKLNVVKFVPCQFKYMYDESGNYSPQELLSCIESVENRSGGGYVILITEGNHVRGGTAKSCINKILKHLPDSKIIYASVGRDLAHLDLLNGTIFETYGFLTNETKSATLDECKKFKAKDKFIIYPWENLEEELEEVNNSD